MNKVAPLNEGENQAGPSNVDKEKETDTTKEKTKDQVNDKENVKKDSLVDKGHPSVEALEIEAPDIIVKDDDWNTWTLGFYTGISLVLFTGSVISIVRKCN